MLSVLSVPAAAAAAKAAVTAAAAATAPAAAALCYRGSLLLLCSLQQKTRARLKQKPAAKAASFCPLCSALGISVVVRGLR